MSSIRSLDQCPPSPGAKFKKIHISKWATIANCIQHIENIIDFRHQGRKQKHRCFPLVHIWLALCAFWAFTVFSVRILFPLDTVIWMNSGDRCLIHFLVLCDMILLQELTSLQCYLCYHLHLVIKCKKNNQTWLKIHWMTHCVAQNFDFCCLGVNENFLW